jgi:hypothetical protein
MGAMMKEMAEGNVGENHQMKSLDVAPLFQQFHGHLKSDALSLEFDGAFQKLSLQ